MEVPPPAHKEVDRTTTDGLINETEVKTPINGIDHWQGSFFYERAKKTGIHLKAWLCNLQIIGNFK